MARIQSLSKLVGKTPMVATHGNLDVSVNTLVSDSREVGPGSLFFALPGIKTSGSQFVDEAIARGAVGVVSAESLSKHSSVAYIQVEDARLALVDIAKAFYKDPQKAMQLVAVTGTKGKTTTTFLVEHLLGFPEVPVGLISSVRYDIGQRTLACTRATPDTADMWRMLAEMKDAGCRHAVMEATSYGIEQRRVVGLPFYSVIFTNLSHDHLDYHGSMEQYFASKARLFIGNEGQIPKFAVINIGDAYGRRLLSMLPEGVRALTFCVDGTQAQGPLEAGRPQQLYSSALMQMGVSRAPFTDVSFDRNISEADFLFRIDSMSVLRTTGSVINREGKAYPCIVPLPGTYNLSNALAALAVCQAMGYALEPLIERLASFPGVAGRMERVPADLPVQVFIDYAHSPDPLAKMLQSMRELVPGKLHIVFGCGGNRDRLKRPAMLSAALRYADYVWATSDNPRNEPQSQIFEDMRRDVPNADKATFIEDRREAIGRAIAALQSGDTLVIAGKGHEVFQEFSDRTVSFNDYALAQSFLAQKHCGTLAQPYNV